MIFKYTLIDQFGNPLSTSGVVGSIADLTESRVIDGDTLAVLAGLAAGQTAYLSECNVTRLQ